MKRFLAGIAMILAVSLALPGCGCGGDDGDEPPANQPPRANAGDAQTVDASDTVTLDGSASSDPDGAIAGYLWAQTAGPAVSLSNANQAAPSFVAPELDAAATLGIR